MGRVAAVTLSQLCSLLLALPFAVQATLVLALVLLVVGVAAVSLAAGWAVAWVQDRRFVPRAAARVRRRAARARIRVARCGPQRLVDRQARVLLAELGDDEREGADR